VSTTHRAIEAVWRLESGRLVAGLTRLVGDVGLAEELAQDALVIALEQWPVAGIPEGPGAWLMATAKHRAIDQVRRRQNYERKLQEVGRAQESAVEADLSTEVADRMDDPIGDDLLRLVFITCHPSLSIESRVALTLKVLGGLSTVEIARAFLVPESTVGMRIVRAKRALQGQRFELPPAPELPARLASVLEAVYLVFNEGYSATAGADWTRPALCQDALRLGRILAGLMPDEPEVHGLLALMELQASRLAARQGPDGEPVLLADQDRRRWDRLLIRHGLAALAKAEETAERLGTLGPYGLQAAIAACHARAPSTQDTDWVRIADLYRVLVHVWPSPVAELNRAVAVGQAHGPEAGLAIVDNLIDQGVLATYPLLPAVRADLLAKLDRPAEARSEFERAAELTRNDRERELFRTRAAQLSEAADRG
jgi:RNA polymerase sigma factor (sigma-70 family)